MEEGAGGPGSNPGRSIFQRKKDYGARRDEFALSWGFWNVLIYAKITIRIRIPEQPSHKYNFF